MLTLTASAATQIRKAAADSGASELALRVAARREADGSIAYGMGFDELREGDMPLEVEGIPLLIAAPSQPLLLGIDYVPTNTTVPSPLKGVKIIITDPIRSLDDAAKWEKLFDDTVINRAGR